MQANAVLITGAFFENHPDAASLRMVVQWITLISGAKHLRLTAGANTAGAWAAGMVPHRDAGGVELEQPGYHADEALKKKLRGYFLLGVEPEFDFTNPHQAVQSMLAAEFVVVMSGFAQGGLLNYADVILPMGLGAETSGTFINVDQTWQTFTGAVAPPGEARPGWKILRVLGNQLKICGFDYQSSDEVRDELKTHLQPTDIMPKAEFFPPRLEQSTFMRVGEWPLYRSDALVRHAPALQNCAAADNACIRLHPSTADALALNTTATVSQGEIEITLPLKRDEGVAPSAVWVANAMAETMNLGYAFASIKIKSE
jgi:NADH-quinone oxidoreductase subunit G